MLRRFEQGARKHSEKFRRRVYRQVEGFAGHGLLALFAAVLPTRATVLNFEMLLDRRLHVIIAAAFVFNRHTGAIELPGCNDVIAAAAIVVGIFGVHRSVSLPFYGLRAGLVALDENFVSAFRVGHLLKRRIESDQLVAKENNRNGRDADDEPDELSFAPVRKHFARRDVRRAFHSLRRHFEGPRDENRDNEPERD